MCRHALELFSPNITSDTSSTHHDDSIAHIQYRREIAGNHERGEFLFLYDGLGG